MAGTPRKSAGSGFDQGGNIVATAGNERPIQTRDAVSGEGRDSYPRKATDLNAGNLPIKRQPQESQSEYRPGNDGAGGDPRGVD